MKAQDDADYREYRPLIDTPDLFLDFAWLADGGEVGLEAWGKWTSRYGVLGLDYQSSENTAPLEESSLRQRGGPWETLKEFEREASRANRLLRLYELVSWPDAPNNAGSSTTDAEYAREQVLRRIRMEVGHTLTECYPVLYQASSGGDSLYVQGWGFRSLLGAMYLQMMWLTSTPNEQVPRCKRPECPKIITFEPPKGPPLTGMKKNDRRMGYRTRKDKEYCSDKCRALDYYYYRQVKSNSPE